MGTHSYSQDCPKCNGVGTLMCCNDTRSYYESGECVNCGFNYYTKDDFYSLEDLNETRANYDLNPLTQEEFDKIEKECNK